MGAVMIRCPRTGRGIPTGMVADRRRFEATPVFFARVLCPICRTEHEWFAKEAWVCEPDTASPEALHVTSRTVAPQDAASREHSTG